MTAVKREVTSSYSISLSKAATILSRFVASDTGAEQDGTAYLRRSLTAFNELMAAHRDIRARRKISHVEDEECASKNDDNRNKIRRKRGRISEQQEEMGGSSKKKMEALDSVKNSEERRYVKENKRKEYRLDEDGRVGSVSESMNTERKKRKFSDAVQGKVDKDMDKHEGKKKKRRTIERYFYHIEHALGSQNTKLDKRRCCHTYATPWHNYVGSLLPMHADAIKRQRRRCNCASLRHNYVAIWHSYTIIGRTYARFHQKTNLAKFEAVQTQVI